MKSLSVFALILGLAVWTPAGFAEIIYGQVTSVDSQNRSVQLTPQYSSHKNMPQSIKAHIEDGAFKKNTSVQSVDQLTVGDDLVMEADRSMSGDWEVHSLARMDELHQQGQGQDQGQGQSQGQGSYGSSSEQGMEEQRSGSGMAQGSQGSSDDQQGIQGQGQSAQSGY
jgi:hypothetical protein